MSNQEQELKALLTNQEFVLPQERLEILERRKQLAQAFAETENGIAVLSDFQDNSRYIYSGSLGSMIGLSASALQTDSAFEEEVFSCILPEELLERHVLELRFFRMLQSMPVAERPYYNMVCPVHFRMQDGSRIPVLHRSYYCETLPNGSTWLALCLYTPFIETKVSGQIVDNRTGQALLPEIYTQIDRQLLSTRETEVLALLAKGQSSKQIADALCISVNTVSRHRQNILSALQVTNTAAAVEIGLRLRLIYV